MTIYTQRYNLGKQVNQYPWNLCKLKKSLQKRKWFRIKFNTQLLKNRSFFRKKFLKTYENKTKALFKKFFSPGITQKQFKKLFKFKNRYRSTFRQILQLEHRIDTLVLRVYMLPNINIARHCVTSGFFLLNNFEVLSPKKIISIGDIIELSNITFWNFFYMHYIKIIASIKKYYSRILFKLSYPFISKRKKKMFKEDRFFKFKAMRFFIKKMSKRFLVSKRIKKKKYSHIFYNITTGLAQRVGKLFIKKKYPLKKRKPKYFIKKLLNNFNLVFQKKKSYFKKLKFKNKKLQKIKLKKIFNNLIKNKKLNSVKKLIFIRKKKLLNLDSKKIRLNLEYKCMKNFIKYLTQKKHLLLINFYKKFIKIKKDKYSYFIKKLINNFNLIFQKKKNYLKKLKFKNKKVNSVKKLIFIEKKKLLNLDSKKVRLILEYKCIKGFTKHLRIVKKYVFFVKFYDEVKKIKLNNSLTQNQKKKKIKKLKNLLKKKILKYNNLIKKEKKFLNNKKKELLENVIFEKQYQFNIKYFSKLLIKKNKKLNYVRKPVFTKKKKLVNVEKELLSLTKELIEKKNHKKKKLIRKQLKIKQQKKQLKQQSKQKNTLKKKKPFWFKRRWVKFYWQKKRINKKLFLFMEFRKKFNNFFYIFRNLQNKKLINKVQFNNFYEINSFIFNKFKNKQKCLNLNFQNYSKNKNKSLKKLYNKIKQILILFNITKTSKSTKIKHIKTYKKLITKPLPAFVNKFYFKIYKLSFINLQQSFMYFYFKNNKFKNFKNFYFFVKLNINFLHKKHIYQILKSNKKFINLIKQYNKKNKPITWNFLKKFIYFKIPLIKKLSSTININNIKKIDLILYFKFFKNTNYLNKKLKQFNISNINELLTLLNHINKEPINNLEILCKIKRKYIKVQGYFRRFLNHKIEFIFKNKIYSKIQIEYKKINLILKYRLFPIYYLEFNYNTLSFTMVNEFDFLRYPYKTLFDFKTISHFYSR